ncbi:SH3 domain-containing protein [Falsiroseomonas sp.]|uniref:SH3 domain-containing protein n=1 Tax=Falsiroseomonas sp. TaxID=2870721 RepID=UPI003F6EDDBA
MLSLLALAGLAPVWVAGAQAQSSLAPNQGNLPPPRPATPAAPRLVPSEQPRSLALPPNRPATPSGQTPSQSQSQAQSQAPSQAQAPSQPASRPAAPRPSQAQPSTPARPQAPAANRPGQPAPTIGRAPPPANRRPAATGAAAGAAAAGAAAGAAAATARPPEPALPASPPPIPPVGSVTGLPLPRFAALRSDEVNMRVGPSTSYPIEWTFQRRDLPVQIIGEFQLWRRIRDADGTEGWVHSSTLAGRRTVLVRPAAPAPEATLRRRPEETANAVARLRPGVIGRIRECAAGAPWCEVQVANHRGYLRRAEIWGVGLEEEIK